MRTLFWACGFESRFACPNAYKAAKALGYECDIAGSRDNPEEFIAKFRQYKPDVVFCFAIRSKLEPYYREIRRTALLVFWYPDQTEYRRDAMWKGLGGKAHLLIFSILDTAHRYRDLAPHVAWMPQYFDDAACRDAQGHLPARAANPEYDLVFLGSTDVVRREWLAYLRSHYKCNFVLDRIGVDGGVRGYEMAQAYANSKIAINIQRRDFDHSGPYITSNRVYNALGSGCFFINHPVEKMGYLFDEGTHCVTHDGTLNDLCRKIDYYLENTYLRESVALRGQKCVLANHTLSVRMREYMSLINHVHQGAPAPVHMTSYGCLVAGYWSEGVAI